MDPIILFDAPTIRKCDKHSRVIAKHLQAVSKNVDFIILWLDCDREGENICFEVLDICRRNIPKVNILKFNRKYSQKCKESLEQSFHPLQRKIFKLHLIN